MNRATSFTATKIKLASLTLVASIWLPSFAVGQKTEQQGANGPVGIFATGAEYDNFMRSAKQSAYGPEGTAEMKAMIPMLNDIALAQPLGTTSGQYNVQGSTLGILSDDKVRADLEMVDEQYEELQQVNEQINSRLAEQIKGLDFSDANGLAERIRGMQEQAQKDLETVLLPHQVSRLQQIHTQSQLRHRSLVDLITSDPVKTDLEISGDQVEELREAEREIQEDLEKEIAELQKKARKRLLSKLKSDQRQQVEEMLGDEFEFTDNDMGDSKRSKRNRGRKVRKGK